MNASPYKIIPKLNATHVFANRGWDMESYNPSCLLRDFAKRHPSVKVAYISHPPDLSGKNKVFGPSEKKQIRLECGDDGDVHVLDCTEISTNVTQSWYWDHMHVLSILNEEFNQQLIKKIVQ